MDLTKIPTKKLETLINKNRTIRRQFKTGDGKWWFYFHIHVRLQDEMGRRYQNYIQYKKKGEMKNVTIKDTQGSGGDPRSGSQYQGRSYQDIKTETKKASSDPKAALSKISPEEEKQIERDLKDLLKAEGEKNVCDNNDRNEGRQQGSGKDSSN